jgi:hypothetical protein
MFGTQATLQVPTIGTITTFSNPWSSAAKYHLATIVAARVRSCAPVTIKASSASIAIGVDDRM